MIRHKTKIITTVILLTSIFSGSSYAIAEECNTANLTGKIWVRTFANNPAAFGDAVWKFKKNGKIRCSGSMCKRSGGKPVKFKIAKVFEGTNDAGMGLIIKFQRLTMTTTCEIDGKEMVFGDRDLTFLKP